MPAYIQGNPYSTRSGLASMDFDYKYPNNVNLKPGSFAHEKIRSAVYNRANESYGVIQKRFPSWNKIDETLTVYMQLDEEESNVKTQDERKPVSIVVPYSYAQLETIVTYLVAAFGQDPMFRYEGTGPEDKIGSTLLELLVQSQSNRFKMLLNLHTMFRDSVAYGLGAIGPYWSQVWGKKITKQENPLFGLFGNLLGKKKTTGTVDSLLYEGNALNNIDPYRFLPDPSYSIHEIQKGDYIGWIDTKSLMDYLDLERRDKDYFNIKYVKAMSSRRSTLFREDSRRDPYGTRDSWVSEQFAKPVDSINMVMKVIPKEYGLPGDDWNKDGEYPEKWLFELAADQIVIRAKPLGLNHDMFPVVTCAPDFDGRTITPISRLETIYGLQETLNFMFNSHVANVRKAINDMLVVDPYLVNMNDLKDPRPGKLIRLRRSAWGKGTKDVVSQLKVVDVTANNIGDSEKIMSIMERVSAATHNMMGIMRPGSERRSAAEFEGTQNSAMNRLERMGKIIGLQAMQDLGRMLASQTQQLMSEEVWVKSSGEWPTAVMNDLQPQQGRVKISPWDLLVDYDLLVRDGSIPGGNFSGIWAQLFKTIMSSPEMAQRFDTMRLFKYIARNMGAKNVEDFERKEVPPVQAQVVPDEQAAAQTKAGNLVPIGA